MATPRSKAAPIASDSAPQETPREAVREVARVAMPVIPGRAVALNRAGKPVNRASAASGVDQFFIPPGVQPLGWSWEWKTETVLGQSNPQYAAQLAQVGWEPVMMESYPGVFAPEYEDRGNRNVGPVRRHGMMLMERAEVLTREAQREEKRRADERVGNSVKQYNRLNTDGAHGVDVDSIGARRLSGIRQNQEVVDLPPAGRQPID